MSLSKLFQRIIFHNNTTPAINEDNLNAMSKAIDDIDDRVILIGDDVVTVIPQIQAYLEQAESIVEAVEELSQNPPYIGANGNWYVFDTTLEAYKDSGVDASITVDIADITMIAEGAQPYVTNTGTNTDPVFHLFLPQSPQGATGNGIANIAKTSTQGLVDTYTITMTDGTTYTFTVTNGQNGSGTGDMLQSDYDSDSTVKNAGGITDYVEGKVEPMLNVLGAKNLLPNTVASQTINGVTFTVNADGSISCSGTSTAELWWNLSVQTPLDTTKEYILSGCPSGGDESSTYSLGASDGNTLWRFDEGSGISFTPTGASNTYITIHIKNGINMTGKVFKPMLRLATIEDDTYVPYAKSNRELTENVEELEKNFANRFILTPRTKYYGVGNKTTLTISVPTSSPASNYMQGIVSLKGYSNKLIDCVVGFNLSNGNASVNSNKFIDHTGENNIALDSITVNGSNVEIVLSGFSAYTWVMIEYANTMLSSYENNTNVPEWTFT